jgi:predicted Zn-dependent peptidase
LSLANAEILSNLGAMKRLIVYPAILLVALMGAKLLFADVAHNTPVDPRSYVLDVGIVGAGSYQISMWVPTGSTSDSVPGIAHVLEHLKFKNRDGNGFAAFDAIMGSSSNAATSYRTTRYDLNVPPAGVAKALDILAAMTKPLSITEEDVKLEKTVVAQELYQRFQSDPDTAVYQQFYSEFYQGLPYANPPGGTQESVASVSLKDVLAFDLAHYKDSKTFLVILGPPLNDTQRAALEKSFPNSAVGTVNVGPKFMVTRDDAELVAAAPILPANPAPAIAVSELMREKTSPRTKSVKLLVSKLVSAPTTWRGLAAATILQDAIRSRLPEGLQDKIAEDNRMVQAWSVSISRLMDGLWQVDFSATVENGVEPASVRKAFEKYFAEISATGLSQKSFDRLKARNFLTSEWESAESRGASLGSDSVVFGYDKAINYMDELKNTELSDVNDLLLTLNKSGRVGEFQLKPEGPTQ